ncbi:hypothetical protein BD779DRAFT_1470904 [Infundibulicybe gibba]|nr:hypothetical protein BD779DRAFT_1470904 [Infundibulicybe gibba]
MTLVPKTPSPTPAHCVFPPPLHLAQQPTRNPFLLRTSLTRQTGIGLQSLQGGTAGECCAMSPRRYLEQPRARVLCSVLLLRSRGHTPENATDYNVHTAWPPPPNGVGASTRRMLGLSALGANMHAHACTRPLPNSCTPELKPSQPRVLQSVLGSNMPMPAAPTKQRQHKHKAYARFVGTRLEHMHACCPHHMALARAQGARGIYIAEVYGGLWEVYIVHYGVYIKGPTVDLSLFPDATKAYIEARMLPRNTAPRVLSREGMLGKNKERLKKLNNSGCCCGKFRVVEMWVTQAVLL